MTVFEFRCLRVTQERVVESEGHALVDALNELGLQGWQLASLCAEQGHEGTYLAILQRKPAPDETSTLCEGTLVESTEGDGTCDAGSACRALGSRNDSVAYRAAHERVVTRHQNENKLEYGGEA